jgi:phosphatidylserine/phosphatidylglycerophosphate/cardiolipin synthase-like enzyme
MPAFMNEDFRESWALLAHELANLDNRAVVRQAVENYENNPNSILNVLKRVTDESDGMEVTRMVSPYLFLARYTDSEGNVVVDEAEAVRNWLEENSAAEIEIITNSVMTSDNFSAQSIIDLNTLPRLLLDPELRKAWLDLKSSEERVAPLTSGEAWIDQVSHPRLRVYETGKLDSTYFNEDGVPYGKLHAKYWLEDDIGYVGTSNFDYRSRLFNNEMGYFFRSDPLADDLNEDFELLKSMSHRWGSPEWLEMREKIREMGGMKGTTTRTQRQIYKVLDKTGLHWLF